MKTFYKIEELPKQCKRAVFRVPTKRGDQFLRTEYVSDEFSVVEVDAAHLLELWRNDTDGAKCFPVMCRTENAELVQLMVGLRDGKPQAIKVLLEPGS